MKEEGLGVWTRVLVRVPTGWLSAPIIPPGPGDPESPCRCPGGAALWNFLFWGRRRADGVRWVLFGDGKMPFLPRSQGSQARESLLAQGAPSLKGNSRGSRGMTSASSRSALRLNSGRSRCPERGRSERKKGLLFLIMTDGDSLHLWSEKDLWGKDCFSQSG